MRGFKIANLSSTLSEFAPLMDVILLGARRAFEVHAPSRSCMSSDEESLIDLCALAQDGHDGPLLAFFESSVVPPASFAAALRLKIFAVALQDAGLHLAPPGAAARQLH